ncbi:putative nucleotidyltransferase with HDIG domain [Nocardia goodfellowii]|uniref:Nucleotidyltransferase with HDIG domain n=1 Tax=Nocardia goodfellowii TaxID=882446 RepID=A0ABS4QC94_9NOCA|nr:putative nucleotidyltransferase with HDIG domain [Nocardia goodfellowii]
MARTAVVLADRLGGDTELLAAAAVLHDVGYAPRLASTGFHPLDGARFLRDEHQIDQRVVRLVANHTCALLEAEERGLHEQLATEFPAHDDPLLTDALIYCDMTTTPDGTPTTPGERIGEIVSRYGPDSVVGRFIRRAEPEILSATSRIEALLPTQPR